MRLRLHAATAVLSVFATAAQAGDVEWTRRRRGGETPPRDQLAFAGGAQTGGLEARSLRRPRSGSSTQAVFMQLSDLSVAGPSESMDYRRRSVTRTLFGDNAREMSGWMTTLRNFDGPEMPFDEMVEAWDDTDKLMHVSKEKRHKKWSRYKHFDLRVRAKP